MLVYVVKVFVKEGYIEDFKKATIKNHKNTLQEPGNIRFDVLQSKEDPTRFTLYEVYESEAAVSAHKETSHYQEWRETVADWMAKSREGLKHEVIAPEARELW
ncbi:MAG: putative quinol monooxygenase [Bacillota bacterium]